jgi:exopolysaccharide biosynthesis polyprenyl glycosylphosphotransferase
MNQQVAHRTVSDLRTLLSEPGRAKAGRGQRVTTGNIRIFVGAVDAIQVVLAGAATLLLFPASATAIGVATAVALATVAVLLAIAVRFALRHAQDLDPPPTGVGAALRAAAAAGAAILTLGVVCFLALARTGQLPSDFIGWIAAWLFASASVGAGLRLAAERVAGALADDRRVIVVGAPEQASALATSLAQAPGGAWRVGGTVDDSAPDGLEQLVDLLDSRGADIVALAISGPDAATRIAAVCDRISDHPVRISLAMDAASLAHLPRALPCVGRFAFIDLVTDPHGGLAGLAKRTLDMTVAGTALVVLLPLFAVVALAIRLESPGSPLFRQWRFGLASRPIQVIKFRTMRSDLCDATGEQRTASRDPRVTRIGRFLRRSSIDELPQLINVLRGDMSLVGPRPHPLHMRIGGTYYFEAVEGYRARHMVKPGITGWAQVNGSRGEVDTLEKARRRVALDRWYLDNWSLLLDIRILLRTLFGGFVSFRAD